MSQQFKIHPAIGIARVGNSPTDYYLAPERPGALPIACDPATGLPIRKDGKKDGKEVKVDTFKDDAGRIKRQAARFRVFAYGDDGASHEVEVGETVTFVHENSGQVMKGTVVGIDWTVYVANKKAAWYAWEELDGEHGYGKKHPLRNAAISDPNLRQQLIIDPGPQSVAAAPGSHLPARAEFSRGGNPNQAQSFPPPDLRPFAIDTLGEIRATRDGSYDRLLVLGGYGCSGSMLAGFGEPKITDYANNDGWFDDVSDGPVAATLQVKLTEVDGHPPIDSEVGAIEPVPVVGAWVLTGNPGYLPQIENIIRLDETIWDVSVRQMAAAPHLYGVPPFDKPQVPKTPEALALWRRRARYNSAYFPYFWRDVWPILSRPQYLNYLLIFDPLFGASPHATEPGGNFDPGPLSIPPYEGEDPSERQYRRAKRLALFSALRQTSEENLYLRRPNPANPDYLLIGMPDLCGDNPITNTVPTKFLALTPTMLFILRQWAEGKFVDERREHLTPPCGTPSEEPLTADELDRGSVANCLGGSFCPGGEVSWIIRNPAIYQEPFRIKPSPNVTPGGLSLKSDLAVGLEPGDLTKYSALPWQADFNECSTQDVDITYENWNEIHPKSIGDPQPKVIQNVFWWPTHRPLMVMTRQGNQVEWTAGIPQNNAGDLLMVSAWSALGFIVRYDGDDPNVPTFYQTERNADL